MKRKWTLEKVKNEFVNKGYTPLFEEYTNGNEKLSCLNDEGYKVTISLHKLLKNRVPMPFSNKNEHTIDNIKKWLIDNDAKIELLSNEFLSAKSKLSWRCMSEESHIFETSWDCVQRGCRCGYCSGKKKYTLDVFKEKLRKVNPNLEVLSADYNGTKGYVKCLCLIDGNIFTTKARYLLKGNCCKVCSGVVEHNIESLVKKIQDINPDVETIDNIYINNRTPMKCLCKKHNKVWYPTPVSLLKGRGCSVCSLEKVSGENNYGWKGGITTIKKHLRKCLTDWKKDTIKSCNYKCDISGERFDVIHHLHSFDSIFYEFLEEFELDLKSSIGEYSFSELSFISNNFIELHNQYGLGVCLKEEFHKEFHEKYGYGENTPDQYYEFKEKKLKEINLESAV